MEVLMVEKRFKAPIEEAEEKLIAKAKRGDVYSFEKLVEKYQKKIYYLALRMTKSHDAADDLAQESFIKAFYSLKSFREGYSFSAWVYRICMNLTLNYLKRQRFSIPQSQLSDGPLAVSVENGKDDLSDQLVRKELREKIEQEIAKLPPDFKAVFILRTYEDLSYEQISKTLKITKGTVMSRLFRARERLQKSLKGYL
jgi:RNA polymerase sigma-70 factor (ECF subfamily)